MAAVEYRERRVGETEGTYVFYADDMTVERVGGTVRITYWERRREGGKIINIPVLEVIRPGHSFKCPCMMIGPGHTH